MLRSSVGFLLPFIVSVEGVLVVGGVYNSDSSVFSPVMSRIPQIFKNRQTKCEGLSLALFLFAVAGNLTYVASILIKSTDREYLIESASWLVGSLGTVFLDFIVLSQFVAYRDARNAMAQHGDSTQAILA